MPAGILEMKGAAKGAGRLAPRSRKPLAKAGSQ
jgi:hypothetical protein